MFSYMSVCLSVLGHVHVTEVDHRYQKSIRTPGAGVTHDYELPEMGAGNPTQDLHKSSLGS